MDHKARRKTPRRSYQQRIKTRKEIVMTQQSLADRAGTTQGMMHCYESGSTNIPFVRLICARTSGADLLFLRGCRSSRRGSSDHRRRDQVLEGLEPVVPRSKAKLSKN